MFIGYKQIMQLNKIVYCSYQINSFLFILILQITLTAIWLWQRDPSNGGLIEGLSWAACCMAANLVVCVLGWWHCFSSNHLYWASIFTWLLINSQGEAHATHAFHSDLSIPVIINSTEL